MRRGRVARGNRTPASNPRGIPASNPGGTVWRTRQAVGNGQRERSSAPHTSATADRWGWKRGLVCQYGWPDRWIPACAGTTEFAIHRPLFDRDVDNK